MNSQLKPEISRSVFGIVSINTQTQKWKLQQKNRFTLATLSLGRTPARMRSFGISSSSARASAVVRLSPVTYKNEERNSQQRETERRKIRALIRILLHLLKRATEELYAERKK